MAGLVPCRLGQVIGLPGLKLLPATQQRRAEGSLTMRIAMLLAPLLIAAAACLADSFTVLDGDRQAVIVCQQDAQAETLQARGDLAAYLKKSTGRDFRAISEREFSEDSGELPIYVGTCRAGLPRAAGAPGEAPHPLH